MGNKTRRMALCGMMVALATVLMLMGGVIPLATFCCPMLASLALIPILFEGGRRWTWMAYAAIAALSLMLSPDKESALLFAFMGYYPALKPTIDRIRAKGLRTIAKLAIFDASAGAMLLAIAFVLRMDAIIAEYAAMGRVLIALFVLMANVTMLLYDRMLAIFAVIYLKKRKLPQRSGGQR